VPATLDADLERRRVEKKRPHRGVNAIDRDPRTREVFETIDESRRCGCERTRDADAIEVRAAHPPECAQSAEERSHAHHAGASHEARSVVAIASNARCVEHAVMGALRGTRRRSQFARASVAAAMLLAGVREARAQSASRATTCDVASEHPDLGVAVSAGDAHFEVQLAGAPAVVHVASNGTLSGVRVDGVLAFEGTTDARAFRPRALALTTEGVVQLNEWALLDSVRAHGDMLWAQATIGVGVRIPHVAIPCASVTLDEVPRAPTATREPACGASHWQSRGRSIVFRARPGSGASAVVQIDRENGGLIVCELERRGPWLRVANMDAVHIDAGQVTGWVAAAGFRRIGAGLGFTGGRSMPTQPRGGRGTLRRSGAGVYQGRARLAEAASVAASPDGPSWARVRDGNAVVEVVVQENEPWAQVVAIPGLAPGFPAWVRRSAVIVVPTAPLIAH